MLYINVQYDSGDKETVDEADTRKEAHKLLSEYNMAYSGTGFTVWISSRCCDNWRE